MEEDLHKKDHLEEFLKDSLESYEEAPPESIWDGIGSNLPVISSGFISYRKPFWWVSGLAALLLILLVYQQFYFQTQIKQLEEKIALQNLDKNTSQDLGLFQEQTIHSSNNSTEESSHLTEEINSNFSKQSSAEQSLSSNKTSESQFRNNNLSPKNNSPLPFEQAREENQKGFKADHLQKMEISKEDSPTFLKPIDTKAQPNPPPIANYEELKSFDRLTKSAQGLTIPGRESQFKSTPLSSIAPIKNKRIAIEAFRMPGKLNNSLDFNLPTDIPYQPRELTRRRVKSSNSTNLGLNIEYQISPRWSIYSGINFQRTENTESHQLSFLRKERSGHRPGRTGTSKDYQYDYNYPLNTSSGLVNMQLKMVQSTTDIIPDDEQAFEIIVTTEEKTASWSIPLFLEYQFGNGKFKPFFRAGFNMHFNINHDFQVKEVSSADKFLKQRPQSASKGFLKYQANTRLDYLVSLGLAYELNEHWQIQLHPSYLASLSDTNKHPLILGKTENLGVAASLKYSF